MRSRPFLAQIILKGVCAILVFNCGLTFAQSVCLFWAIMLAWDGDAFVKALGDALGEKEAGNG